MRPFHTSVPGRDRVGLAQSPLAGDGLFGPSFAEVLAHQQSICEKESVPGSGPLHALTDGRQASRKRGLLACQREQRQVPRRDEWRLHPDIVRLIRQSRGMSCPLLERIRIEKLPPSGGPGEPCTCPKCRDGCWCLLRGYCLSEDGAGLGFDQLMEDKLASNEPRL
ncbi:unnamed protein product [Boreogadus saida]